MAVHKQLLNSQNRNQIPKPLNSFYRECECLDAPEPTTEAPMECAVPQWAGDNFCDDENNNPECGFDGGDCCDNTGEGWDNYCSLCECLEMPETTEPPMETTEEPWYTTEDPMETTEGKERPSGQVD